MNYEPMGDVMARLAGLEGKTGIEELRRIVANMDHCRESFLERFTLDELVQIHRMWLASEWDFFPDTWTEGQIKAALAGTPPQWDSAEKPIEPASALPEPAI